MTNYLFHQNCCCEGLNGWTIALMNVSSAPPRFPFSIAGTIVAVVEKCNSILRKIRIGTTYCISFEFFIYQKQSSFLQLQVRREFSPPFFFFFNFVNP